MSHKIKEATTVYKKLYVRYRAGGRCDAVATLLLPKGTLINKKIRSEDEIDMFGEHKNRASKAKVVRIDAFVRDARGMTTKRRRITGFSAWDYEFIYRVGKTVKPKSGFNLTRETCASGIHFFQTYDKARWY